MAELLEATKQVLREMGLPAALIESCDDDASLPDPPVRPAALSEKAMALLRNCGVPEHVLQLVDEDVRTGSPSGVEPLALREERLQAEAKDEQRTKNREAVTRHRLRRQYDPAEQPSPEQQDHERALSRDRVSRYRVRQAEPTTEEIAEAKLLHQRELKARRMARWRAKLNGSAANGTTHQESH